MKAVYRLGISAIALGLLALQGCTGVRDKPADVEDHSVGVESGTGAGSGMGEDGATASGVSRDGELAISPFDNPESPLSKRVFYFPFDSGEVSPADRQILAAHADYLSRHPEVSVVVEGHADERGSREYNLALGERRANGVGRLLTLGGVANSQMQTVSFGEERPVAIGHSEDAWGVNRRVELLYSGY